MTSDYMKRWGVTCLFAAGAYLLWVGISGLLEPLINSSVGVMTLFIAYWIAYFLILTRYVNPWRQAAKPWKSPDDDRSTER